MKKSTSAFSNIPKSDFWKIAVLLPAIFLFSLGKTIAQCNPDVTPPTAVCVEFIDVPAAASGVPATVLNAVQLNSGSFDECGLAATPFLIRRFEDGPCDDDAMPDPFSGGITFCCADLGVDVIVEFQVTDAAGNANICLVTAHLLDKLKPICNAPANLTLSCENYDPNFANAGSPTFSDNCTIDTVVGTVNFDLFDDFCKKGTISRTFSVVDESGNSSNCTQRIVVEHKNNFFIKFPDDVLAVTADPNNFYGEPQFDGVTCELLAVSYEDEFFNNSPDCDYKIERTFRIINFCNYDPIEPCVYVPNFNPFPLTPNIAANLVGPTVSAPGTTGAWSPTVYFPTPGTVFDYSIFWDADANCWEYKQIIKIGVAATKFLQGFVFLDTLNNCQFDNSEQPLAGWPVKITSIANGNSYHVLTNANGFFSQGIFGADSLYEVTLELPGNFAAPGCSNSFVMIVEPFSTTIVNFPVHLETECPILSVDISAPFLRRCFRNKYFVNYTNLSAQTIDNVHVEVDLDSLQNFVSSTVPGTLVAGNTYNFELGNLAAGQSGGFEIEVDIPCAAPLGATHCTSAHIFPDTICPQNAGFSGSNLEVSGFCDQDSVRLFIKNTGSGDMDNPLEYIVVEDVIMYRTAGFQLGAGETMAVPAMAADGSTWRLEAPQETGHPFFGISATAVEGCGGLNTPGLVNLFSMNSPNPFESVDCQQNIGSFDPNDKLAFPRGFENLHLIEANTDLEYLIRFQNTGTDTAFKVVVLDTLSQFLDAVSVRPGAASHEFSFSILDGKTLRFTFENILLPDSNKNEVASHGFVKFRVKQTANNPISSKIENSAAIYFDFNDPVLTPKIFHTIGENFILTSSGDPKNGFGKLKFHPNPASKTVYFELPEGLENGRFSLSDNFGKTVLSHDFSGKIYRFEKNGLPEGVYFFKILAENGAAFSGKMILK